MWEGRGVDLQINKWEDKGRWEMLIILYDDKSENIAHLLTHLAQCQDLLVV